MNSFELHKKIDVVLQEECRAYTSRGRQFGALGSMNIGLQSMPNNGWTAMGSIPQLLFDKSDSSVISSPNATILIKLYSSLDQDGKNDLKMYLRLKLIKDSTYAKIAYFLFFVLYRIGDTEDALQFARRNLKNDEVYGYSNLIGILSMIVSREYLEIRQATYERIKLILHGETEPDFHLMEKINLALLRHMERDLDDVNPEVNFDRDKVLEIWGRKFTSSIIPSLISEIDDYFREGDFTETKFATCIDRIRILLVEVTKKIAQKISIEKNDNKINESSDEHKIFDYLKSEKFISDNEWNLIRSLYGISSETGAHVPTSNREYARLCKNIAYEIILLLLSK